VEFRNVAAPCLVQGKNRFLQFRGRGEERGGEVVPRELGRVPGSLEVGLSPEAREFYRPQVEALQRETPGPGQFQDAG
jgi:hypothetical protein